jgi:DNA-binding Lrp family transcriptional regulator
MVVAFILINSEINAEDELLKDLKKLPEVEFVYLVFGIYDLIVKINAKDMDDLKNRILKNLRVINNIQSSITLITI